MKDPVGCPAPFEDAQVPVFDVRSVRAPGLALLLVSMALAPTASAASGVHLAWLGDGYGVTFTAPTGSDPAVSWSGPGGGSVPVTPRGPAVEGGARIFAAEIPREAVTYEVDGRTFPLQRPPASDEGVRLAFFADMGSEEASWRTMEAIAREEPSLVVAGGDLHYADGRPGVAEAWLARAEVFAARAALMTAPGDHERLCTEGDLRFPCEQELASYREHFAMPDDGRLFFDVDWGPVHVVLLDSEAYQVDTPEALKADAGEQEAFLAASLAERPAAWNVVVFHRTLYTTATHHGPDETARERLVPILEAGGADLVLMGNEHNYERSWPMLDGAATARRDDVRAGSGVVYVTSGGAGRALYDAWGPPEPWSAVRAAEGEFLVLDATPHLLRVVALRPDGSRLDAFSIAAGVRGAVEQAVPLLQPAAPGEGNLAIPAPSALAAIAAVVLFCRRRGMGR